MHAPLATNRQRYYHLLALVCEDLPDGLVDAMLRAGHEASASHLIAVRAGRKPHLAWLIDMVEAGLPQFKIAEELRPIAAETSLFLAQD